MNKNDAEYLRPKHAEKIGKSLYIITQEPVSRNDVLPLRKVFDKYKSIDTIYVVGRDYSYGDLNIDLLLNNYLIVLSRYEDDCYNNESKYHINLWSYDSTSEIQYLIHDLLHNNSDVASADELITMLKNDGVFDIIDDYFYY